MSNTPQNNRVRGPTSALSSFLREHGIRVENRSRRERREQREREAEGEAEGEAEAEGETGAETDITLQLTETTEETPHRLQETTSLTYTPRRSTRNTTATNSQETSTESKQETKTKTKKNKKKRGNNSSDDNDSDGDFVDPAVGSSSKASKQRSLISFCIKCGSRFSRIPNPLESEENQQCPSCLQGCVPKKAKGPAKKRRIGVNGSTLSLSSQQVPSLQDACINIIARHIEDVEALGDISFVSMEKIARIIARNRQLTDQTARLFMSPVLTELVLTDCTNIEQAGLMNIAHFCPRLEKLNLTYCGRMSDAVVALYASHLKKLHSLELSGAHLITEKGWNAFFDITGPQLRTLGIRHSMRFTAQCCNALTTTARQLKHLALSRITTTDASFLQCISTLQPLESLEISWPEKKIPAASFVHLLEHQTSLKKLTLDGCVLVDDTVLQALIPLSQLQTLSLAECDLITSEAIQVYFERAKTVSPGHGLTHLNLSRCLLMEDEALCAIVHHSYKSLTHLELNGLDFLTSYSLEYLAGQPAQDGKQEIVGCKQLAFLDCGFVRAVDDFVISKLIKTCLKLKHIKVWGCYQLTEYPVLRPDLVIEGREGA